MHTNPKWWSTILRYLNDTDSASSSVGQFAIPASAEFLVNPSYRVYIDTNNKINCRLLENLKNKQTYYTPYLGTSSMICSVNYVNQFDYLDTSPRGYVPVNSIIPFSEEIPQIELKKESSFAIEEDLSVHIDNKRRPQGTYSVIYNPDTGPINITNEEDLIAVQIKDDVIRYVKFLPTEITS